MWLAVWDAGEVRRYAPDGTLRATLATPVARPSALALVGELLVVTTARRDLARPDGEPPPDPEGRLYAYPPVLNPKEPTWSCWTGSPPSASASG